MKRISSHGIAFVPGADFANFVVESLLTNPTALTRAGRIFFNETEKQFRATTLGAEGQVILTTLAQASDITNLNTSLEEYKTLVSSSQGATNVGVSEVASGTITVAAGDLQTVLAGMAAAIDQASQGAGQFEQDLASTEAGKGTGLVGFVGHAATNFSVAAGTLEGSLKAVIGEISTVKQAATDAATDLAANYLDKTTTDPQTVASSAVTFQNNVVIEGDIITKGQNLTVESETVVFADNKLLLNSNVLSGIPTEDAGLAVSRGDEGELDILVWREAVTRMEIPVWDETINEGAGGFVYQGIATLEYVDAAAVNKIDQLLADLASVEDEKGSSMIAYPGITVGSTTVEAGDVKTSIDALVSMIEDLGNANSSGGDLINAVISATGLTAETGALGSFSGSAGLQAASNIKAGVEVVDARVTATAEAVDTLTQTVNTLATESAQADTDLNTRVDTLVSSINEKVFTFTAGSAALDHTLNHNLNSQFLELTVWVEDPDGKWRQHLIFIEEVDSNNILISLAEARRIKAVVRSADVVNGDLPVVP